MLICEGVGGLYKRKGRVFNLKSRGNLGTLKAPGIRRAGTQKVNKNRATEERIYCPANVSLLF